MRVVSPGLLRKSISDFSGAGESHLTPREEEVLRLITLGKSSKEIAWEVGIRERTVRFHLKNLFRKFQVANRLELFSALLRSPIRKP